MSAAPYSHRPELDRATGVLTANHTSLATIATCETKAWLWANGYTSKEDAIAATAGQAWHEAMATLFRRGSLEDVAETFATSYREFADAHVDPNGPLARLGFDNVAYILGVWLSRYVIDDENMLRIAQNNAPLFRILPDYVEISVTAPVSEQDGLVVRGRLDAIVEEPHAGHWQVLDHKTTGQISSWWVQQWGLHGQVTIYTWLAQQHVIQAGRNVLGGLIAATELSKTPGEDPERKCGTHKVKYAECRSWPPHVKSEFIPAERSQALIDKMLKDVRRDMNRLRELMLTSDPERALRMADMRGTRNGGCQFCFAKQWCVEGRNVKDLGAMFVKEEVENG